MWRNVKGSDGCMGCDGQQQGSTRRGVYSTTAAACIFLTLRPGWKSLHALQSLSVAELWEGIMFRDTLFMCTYQAYRGHEIANWSKQILLLYFFMLWPPNSRAFFIAVVFPSTSLWLSYDFIVFMGEESSGAQGPAFSLKNATQETLTQEQSNGGRQSQFSLKSALANNFLIWHKTKYVKPARFLV